jgi:hypothetical protein
MVAATASHVSVRAVPAGQKPVYRRRLSAAKSVRPKARVPPDASATSSAIAPHGVPATPDAGAQPGAEPATQSPRHTDSPPVPRATPYQRPRHTESPAPAGIPARSPRPGTASRNAQENTIARFPLSAYHGYMTSRQAPKRSGSMNPAPRLSAALADGVVAW